MSYSTGQRVRMLKSVGDPPSGDSPGGTCAFKGDIVIVRKVNLNAEWFPFHVSHEDVTDGSTFGVAADEIELAIERPATQEGGGK